MPRAWGSSRRWPHRGSAGLFAALPAGAGRRWTTPPREMPASRRRPRQLPGARRRRDGPARPAQDRPAGAPAPDPGLLHGKRRRDRPKPAPANSPRPRGAGPAGAHRRNPVSPHRRRGCRPRQDNRRQAPGRGVPAHRDHLRRHRQTRPVLALRPGRIDAEAAADGWYALLANLPPAQASPAEVFLRYKGQHVVERRYGEFKGPLAVTPLFLKTSRRIAALITVICLALLIFCLIERQVRKALAPHGGKMTGLPGYRLTPADTHRQNDFHDPLGPAPDPRPRRQPRHDPQTRRRPSPATRPPRNRHQPAPLAHEVKSHVRRGSRPLRSMRS